MSAYSSSLPSYSKDDNMSKNNKLSLLKSANNTKDLSEVLSVPFQALTYALYGLNRLRLPKYTTFTIPKKDGTERKINAPVKDLKDIQKKVSALLQECFRIICILEGHREHDKEITSISHGFIKGKSIITNAIPHKNSRYVLNLDLKDFFGQIHFGRVYGFFKSNKHFELEDEVAKALANICCYQSGLPQGAPTSPIVSNLIAGILDIRLASLAKKHSCFYTRYADDLTFSTNLKVFPKELAILENGSVTIGTSLNKVIDKCGFEVNIKKNRLQFCDSRQDVTGLIVNKKVNVPSHYRNRARVIWHKMKNGKEIYAINSKPENKENINYVTGILGHIHNVRREHRITTATEYVIPKKPTKALMDSIFDADSRMYRDVLFFKNFVSGKKPLIVCEGKTDIVYLKCALHSQAAKHRSLVVNKELKVDFFRPSKTIGELFRVTGGTGDIGNLISNYSSYCDEFKRFSLAQPVIILIDNDSGAPNVRSLVSQITKSKFLNTDTFTHIIKNLYILQTPLVMGVDSAIEDFFDAKTLNEKLGNKSFSYKGNFDSSKHYGKNHFAEYVVKVKKNSIDFKGFNVLFDSIKSIIKDYKSKPH